MTKGSFRAPEPVNERAKAYGPGSEEKRALKAMLASMASEEVDIPMVIGGKEIRTGNTVAIRAPHDHKHILGHFHLGDTSHVEQAIGAALEAKEAWSSLSWEQRASIFLRAAELLAKPYRAKVVAATMLGQSKTVFQAEIDIPCSLIDHFKYNVHFMTEIFRHQPVSLPGTWNRMEYRPLEGFVFAVTPFNFTSIGGNLPTAPALVGNTVVWKPARTQIYSVAVLMDIFREAGMPDGVINLICVEGPVASDVILRHPDFAGLHFTGSTETFRNLWRMVGDNLHTYKTFPRLVGESGGKNYVIVHKSADTRRAATALTLGAFEYQGQKCSAASRAYIPESLWDEMRSYMLEDVSQIKMGSPEDFTNFMTAVIDQKAFDKIKGYIDDAKASPAVEVVAGGGCDDSTGYFIEPTILRTTDPHHVTMCDEIFGPVLTVYVYQDERFEEVLELTDKTSPYALTGSIFARDRYAIELAGKKLVNSAGNFFINDKPTGGTPGLQPFGGARSSGTNDKVGSIINLLRWMSPRTIKENFLPPDDFRYPFMAEE